MTFARGARPPGKHDAIVIGAGLGGMCQLYSLRTLGLDAVALEAGQDLGGTWYWNRYPGARLDSESYTYGYSFSQKLLDEWDWPERFCTQPYLLKYCNYVAQTLDLRKDIRFNSRVVSATYNEGSRSWIVATENGNTYEARFLVTALGPYSAPVYPRLNIDAFRGETYHTYFWPHDREVRLEGKRVAVIGTGSTGIQVIQTIAKTVGHLTVFQRRPNWCTPLWNKSISSEEMASIRKNYSSMFDFIKTTPGGFIHMPDPRKTLDLAPDEREAFFEAIYQRPGLGVWQGNLSDLGVSQDANDLFAAFLARKIESRIANPSLVKKLLPKDHGPGTKRIQQEIDYYEAFNRSNVALVDVDATPIERILPDGIQTTDATFQFDIIIYATGFDVATGPFDRIDIRGVGGMRLKEKWNDGPVTLLGLAVNGFPNMLTVVGPHNAAARCNMVRCIEQNVEWIADLLRFMERNNYSVVEATTAAEDEWTSHVKSLAEGRLYTKVRSAQYTGINTNVEGRDKVRILTYTGGVPAYRARCDAVARSGYKSFQFH